MRRYLLSGLLTLILIGMVLLPTDSRKISTVSAAPARSIPVNMMEIFQPPASIAITPEQQGQIIIPENIIKLQPQQEQGTLSTWSVGSIVSSEIDPAGKYRVWVSITDGATNELLMLKFNTNPGSATVLAEAVKAIYFRNNPPPRELTSEELKDIITNRDNTIFERERTIEELQALRTQMRAILDNTKLNAVQKIAALKALLGG